MWQDMFANLYTPFQLALKPGKDILYLMAHKMHFFSQNMSYKIILDLIRPRVSFGFLAGGVSAAVAIVQCTTNISASINKEVITSTPTHFISINM